MVTILKAIHSNLFHMVSQRIPCLFHIAVRTRGRLSELQFDRRLPRKRNENFVILLFKIVRTVTFFAETYAAVYPVVIDGNIAYVLLFAKRDERVPCLVIRRKLAGAAFAGASSAPASSAARDILSALVALGYSEREAAAAVKKLPEDTGVSDGIRLALKSLSR